MKVKASQTHGDCFHGSLIICKCIKLCSLSLSLLFFLRVFQTQIDPMLLPTRAAYKGFADTIRLLLFRDACQGGQDKEGI